MLPTTIEQGFDEPVAVQFPELCDGREPVTELDLKPYTQGDISEIQEQFGICRRCDGMGQLQEEGPDGEKRKVPCPTCAGKVTGKSGLDLDVRLAIGRRIIRGGRHLIGTDPITKEIRSMAWSEKLRDGLCHTLVQFYLIVGKAQQLGAAQDAAKKGSTTPPPDGSPTDRAPDGASASASGS